MGQFPNAKIRKTGIQSIIYQHEEWDSDPVRGQVVRFYYEGVGPDACAAWYNVYRSQNIACSLRRSGVRSQLTATVSGNQLNDAAEHNWQLLNNAAQRSIFKSPLAINLEAGSPGSLAFIRATYDDLVQQDATTAQDAVNALPADDIKVMLNYLLQGTTHFDVSQPVLKYSGSISNFYLGDVPTSDGSMVVIWPTATLLHTFAIPPFESRRISSLAQPFTIARYQWGWLQMGSTIITDAQNRKTISTEWVYDQWSTDFYDVA